MLNSPCYDLVGFLVLTWSTFYQFFEDFWTVLTLLVLIWAVFELFLDNFEYFMVK